MRQTLVLSLVVAMAWLSSPATAQTPTTPGARPPVATTGASATGLFIGATAGAESVQNVGALFGGEVGFVISDRLDVFGEGVWLQDVVTRRRLEIATAIAASLQNSQGKAATGTVVAPGGYGGAGVHVLLMTTGKVRPYVVFTVGGAHITLKPVFSLSGSDVTTSLTQYGITLGSDLTGEVTKTAFSGGAGARFSKERWYADGGVRVISIRTTDQTTNVLRASASLGLKF